MNNTTNGIMLWLMNDSGTYDYIRETIEGSIVPHEFDSDYSEEENLKLCKASLAVFLESWLDEMLWEESRNMSPMFRELIWKSFATIEWNELADTWEEDIQHTLRYGPSVAW